MPATVELTSTMKKLLYATLLAIVSPALIQAQTTCGEGAPERSITICTPAEGQVYNDDRVDFLAHIQQSGTVFGTKVYLDGATMLNYSGGARDLKSGIGVDYGKHRLTVRTWDGQGYFDKSVTFSRVPGCDEPVTGRQVVICTPKSDAEVPSGQYILISAKAADTEIPDSIKLYVDGVVWKLLWNTRYLDAKHLFSSGTHRITVRAWDSKGYYSSTEYVIAVP